MDERARAGFDCGSIPKHSGEQEHAVPAVSQKFQRSRGEVLYSDQGLLRWSAVSLQLAIHRLSLREPFEKALNITLNSVVFRSSGRDLTTTGRLDRDGVSCHRAHPSGPCRPQPRQTLTQHSHHQGPPQPPNAEATGALEPTVRDDHRQSLTTVAVFSGTASPVGPGAIALYLRSRYAEERSHFLSVVTQRSDR